MTREVNATNIISYIIQGLNSKTKQRLLADDFIEKDALATLIQEIKIQGKGEKELNSSDEVKLTLYRSGNKDKSRKGVGILVRKDTIISFVPVFERICIAEIKLGLNNKLR